MQTFLPFPDFAKSARVLDNKRLGKQRVEAKQIYLALAQPEYGWQNHPAVRMWRGHQWALACYGLTIATEWVRYGFKDTLVDWFYARAGECYEEYKRTGKPSASCPPWFGDPAFHASHRSNLLRKDPVWYGQFGWTEGPDLPYVWPTH